MGWRCGAARCFLLGVATTLPLLGCGADGMDGNSSAVGSVVRQDSAGVEIVAVTIDRGAAPAYAVFDTTPELRLGSLVGSAGDVFGRIEDVLVLRGGGLAVLDGLSAEVRFFDAQGRFEGSVGGKGDGPGEFQSPVALVELPGDTFAVFDPVPRRITRFGPDRAFASATTLDDPGAFISAARFLSDGTVVSQSHRASTADRPPPVEPTVVRDTVVLTSFDETGRVVDTIDVVASREDIVSIQISPGAVSVRKRQPSFARTNHFAPAPAGLWSSSNDSFELRLRDVQGGRLSRIVRVFGLERAATGEVAEVLYQQALSDAESAEERNWLRSWFELSPIPELQPAYDILEVDGAGRLWVREWTPMADGRVWWIFAPDGAPLGSTIVPSAMRITSVQCGSVVGVEQDEFGVDYVVRYAVRERGEC
ncbi:MAG: hypothetical protein HKN73_11990 [Gemmatimonadetes bacterium]|nr:hypothetical protein [Gemmatimonadota bacterium]